MDVRVDEFAARQDDAAETASLAVDMFGRRIDDAIGAELQRLLQDRRGEDIVDDKPRAMPVRDVRDGFQVVDFEARIGRGFEEEDLGFRPHRGFPLGEIGAIDKRRRDAEPGSSSSTT